MLISSVKFYQRKYSLCRQHNIGALKNKGSIRLEAITSLLRILSQWTAMPWSGTRPWEKRQAGGWTAFMMIAVSV